MHLNPGQIALAVATCDRMRQAEKDANDRQGRRTDLHPTSGPTGPEVEEGRSVEVVAHEFGIGSGTLKRARRLVKAADAGDPEAGGARGTCLDAASSPTHVV